MRIGKTIAAMLRTDRSGATAMNNSSTIKFLHTPRQRPLDAIVERPFVTLIGAGILNPMGPTLTTLVIDSSFPFQRGSDLSFVRIMLNPFSQEAMEVATVRVSDNWSPFDELPRFFSGFGCCPTLL